MQTLYDFIFIDHDRVRSIYTQLFDGLHEAMERVASESTSKSSKGQIGGDPFGHASHEVNTVVGESSADKFNPHDLILRDVMGRLTELEMISSEPECAPIGSFVLLKGQLTLLDVGIMRSFVELIPAFADSPTTSQFSSLPKAHRKGAAKTEAHSMKIGLKLIEFFGQMMPQVVQFTLADDRVTAWGAVQQKNMRVEVAHVLLQQGPTLAGQWYVLGIVDSEKKQQVTTSTPFPSVFDGIYTALSGMRDVFAKPEDDIIITPLLIFRKLNNSPKV